MEHEHHESHQNPEHEEQQKPDEHLAEAALEQSVQVPIGVEAHADTMAQFINDVTSLSERIDTEALRSGMGKSLASGLRAGSYERVSHAKDELVALFDAAPHGKYNIDNRIVLEQILKSGSMGSDAALDKILKHFDKFPSIIFDAAFANELIDRGYSGKVASHIDAFGDSITPELIDKLFQYESNKWILLHSLDKFPDHTLNDEHAKKLIFWSDSRDPGSDYGSNAAGLEKVIEHSEKFSDVDWNSIISLVESERKKASELSTRSQSSSIWYD